VKDPCPVVFIFPGLVYLKLHLRFRTLTAQTSMNTILLNSGAFSTPRHLLSEYTLQPKAFDPYYRPMMPQTSNLGAKEEHLVFVKNVPADLATATIPDLYARYKPLRVKNVYPKGDITTIVLAFRTFKTASQAQQDTDGLCLDNVVLRVEMYSQHRSIRYLREVRTSSRPLNVVDEDDNAEFEESSAYAVEDGYKFHSEQVYQGNTGAATWAQIARHDRQRDTRPLPATAIASHPQCSITVEEATIWMPTTTIAVPRIPAVPKTDDGHSGIAGTDETSVGSSYTSSARIVGFEGDVEDKCQTTRLAPDNQANKELSSIFALWEPIDTNERIRQHHCRDCTFCQMLLRLHC
jgi:hypothetical protein